MVVVLWLCVCVLVCECVGVGGWVGVCVLCVCVCVAGWVGGWVGECFFPSVKQVTQLRVLSPKETFFLVESVAKARGGRAGEGQSLGGIMPLTAPVVRNVLGRLKGEK